MEAGRRVQTSNLVVLDEVAMMRKLGTSLPRATVEFASRLCETCFLGGDLPKSGLLAHQAGGGEAERKSPSSKCEY